MGTWENHEERIAFGGWRDTASSRGPHGEGAGGIKILTFFPVSLWTPHWPSQTGIQRPLYPKQVREQRAQ